MNIILVSFVTSSNIGDQLIVKTLSEQLLKQHKVIKYSYNLEKEKSTGQTFSVKKDSKLKKIYLNYLRKLTIVDVFRDRLNKRKIDSNPNWEKFKFDLSKADVVIFGGGNAIFDLTKNSSSYYNFNKITDVAKKMNKIVFASSIGIGPFMSEKQIEKTNEALSKCDYITVRDKKSYSYLDLEKDNRYLSVDPVFSLKKGESNIKIGDKIKVGICIIDLMNNKQKNSDNIKYIEELSSLIIRISHENNYEIYLYSSEPRDYDTVSKVYESVRHLENVYYVDVNSIEDLLVLYSSLSIVLGARMHSLIVAISQNIPVIGFSWQPKVTSMFEMINDKQSVFNIDQIKENEEQILNIIKKKLGHHQKNINSYKLKQELNNKFKINYEILEKIEAEILK